MPSLPITLSLRTMLELNERCLRYGLAHLSWYLLICTFKHRFETHCATRWPAPNVAFTVLAQQCDPKANETELGTALFTRTGEGRDFIFHLLTFKHKLHSRLTVYEVLMISLSL